MTSSRRRVRAVTGGRSRDRLDRIADVAQHHEMRTGEQQPVRGGARVPLAQICQHAREDAGPHSALKAMVNRTDTEIAGLDGP